MSTLISRLIEQDGRIAATPAMQRVRRMAATPGVEVVERQDHSRPAEDLLSLWNVRLQNMHSKKRRFVGLPALVRKLSTLEPTEPVKQITLRNGPATGLLFYTAVNRKPLGAVLSVLNEKDKRRSQQNWLRAMGRDVNDKHTTQEPRAVSLKV